MLAIIGEHFDVGNEVCGAVISVRFSEDILSIWNRNADNTEATAKLAETCVKREVCAIATAPRFTSRFSVHTQAQAAAPPPAIHPDGVQAARRIAE